MYRFNPRFHWQVIGLVPRLMRGVYSGPAASAGSRGPAPRPRDAEPQQRSAAPRHAGAAAYNDIIGDGP
ncbi:hypothetical protein BVIET440_150050 [Burkholderia vietnamiensis]|nr:hypothetical protein BVI1335_1650062 [Burkholderia vietnamiensis]CAG9205084.1 hypothetical protein BVI2075_350060 [Burkholderia vietnamiensis]